MTWKDFVCLEWQSISHLSTSDEHCTVRNAKRIGHKFQVCSHVPTEDYKQSHPYARQYEHYMVDGVIYKSRKKLLEAIEKL